ncbi:polyadenylate-binding protein RBP45B [Tanacetum coccineum]
MCAYEALENHYSYWDGAGPHRVMQVFLMLDLFSSQFLLSYFESCTKRSAYEALENHYSYWDGAGPHRVMQVFVGDLDPNVTAKHLKQLFRHYGQLGHGLLRAISRAEEALKIPQGTQYGVVVLQVNKFVKDDEL